MNAVTVWPIKLVRADTLVPHKRNPRQIAPDRLEVLKKNIMRQGFRTPPCADHEGVLLAGHQRIKALIDLGLGDLMIPVSYAPHPISEELRKEILAADNLAFGEWDMKILQEDYTTEELTTYGFEEDFFVDEEPDTKPVEGEDDHIEPPANPRSRLGDLYEIGNHRLVCGDSTDLDTLGRILSDKRADLVFTDPPWNVNYGDVEKGNAQGYKPRKILNDHMGEDDWAVFVKAICEAAHHSTEPGAPIYVVMSAQEWPAIDKGLRVAGFHWSSTIIWAKDSLVLSRKDYHTQYEPIWYGWNSAAPRLQPLHDRTQSDVWNIPRPKRSELHPTTKPVDLCLRAIINSSVANDVVLDLFGGSGSTMVAAEKAARRCRMVELDPQYCDVIVERMVKLFPGIILKLNGEVIAW